MSILTSQNVGASNNIQANWTAIHSLAPERFNAYKRTGDTDELDAVARYAWNIAVCQELQSQLHLIEITFRNQLHNALTVLHGATWFNNPRLLSLDEQKSVDRAKKQLQQLRRPDDPGRVVAELNFGFWTQLYGKSHENDIVRPTIHSVFAHYAGTTPLKRAAVSGLLREIRLVRNRISHHEHVVFDPNLPKVHSDMVKLLQWMHPQMAELAGIQDGFLSVYGKSWPEFRGIVETLFS